MTHQSSAVYAESGLEVGRFMERMLEAVAQSMAVGPDEVRLHLHFANHPVPGTTTLTLKISCSCSYGRQHQIYVAGIQLYVLMSHLAEFGKS